MTPIPNLLHGIGHWHWSCQHHLGHRPRVPQTPRPNCFIQGTESIGPGGARETSKQHGSCSGHPPNNGRSEPRGRSYHEAQSTPSRASRSVASGHHCSHSLRNRPAPRATEVALTRLPPQTAEQSGDAAPVPPVAQDTSDSAGTTREPSTAQE